MYEILERNVDWFTLQIRDASEDASFTANSDCGNDDDYDGGDGGDGGDDNVDANDQNETADDLNDMHALI